MPASSDSIFTPSKPKEDIRHDVDVVQKCWSREKMRRFRRALCIVIPLVALPLAAYVVFAIKHPQYRPSRISDPPVPEEMYENENKPAVKEESTDIPSVGNPDARLVISVVPQLAGEDLMALLYEAVEAKPSEIFLKTVQDHSLPEAERRSMQYMGTCGLNINGKEKFMLDFPNGKKKSIELDGPFTMAYRADDLCLVITREHERLYGKPAVPIFSKIDDINANVEKSIPVRTHRDAPQTFEFLQTPQEIQGGKNSR